MKLITREIDYSIRAIIYLSENLKKIISVDELQEKLSIARPFLRKIMQILAKADIIKSYKGYHGGFKLAKNPKDIYIIDLIEIFQGKFSLNECVLNKNICPNRNNCILKTKIEGIEKKVIEELETINIKSLIKNN